MSESAALDSCFMKGIGNSNGTTTTTTAAAASMPPQRMISTSDEDQQQQQQEGGTMLDARRRRRMQSNRESARRSRLRKQQHLDELRSMVAQLRAENNHMLGRFTLVSQHFARVSEENRVLEHEAAQLSERLRCLQQRVQLLNPHHHYHHHSSAATAPAPAPSPAPHFSKFQLLCHHSTQVAAHASSFNQDLPYLSPLS